MKKPRTGGAGLLGFHWGEPVMARDCGTLLSSDGKRYCECRPDP
jgi:hypothetical protein